MVSFGSAIFAARPPTENLIQPTNDTAQSNRDLGLALQTLEGQFLSSEVALRGSAPVLRPTPGYGRDQQLFLSVANR